VLDTLSACWSGEEDSNAELGAFDRDVLKPLQAAGTSTLVLDHTGNPQSYVRRRGVSAPRGASSKGQKTDFLIEFTATGDGAFRLERGKKRGTHGKEPRAYQVVDTEDGDLELVESEAAGDVRDLAGEIVELLEDDEWRTANSLRKPKKHGGVGADVDAIKEALATDVRFESTTGDNLGKRKDSTYYRLRQASSAPNDASDGHDAWRRNEKQRSVVSPKETTLDVASSDPAPSSPLTTRCLVCEMEKPARIVAGVTYLACGHIFVAENEELPF